MRLTWADSGFVELSDLTLRVRSLITPQFCPNEGEEPVSDAMKPVGVPQEYALGSKEDGLVAVCSREVASTATACPDGLLLYSGPTRPCDGEAVEVDG